MVGRKGVKRGSDGPAGELREGDFADWAMRAGAPVVAAGPSTTVREWPTASCVDLREAARHGVIAGAIGGAISGAPSMMWALATGGDPLEGVRAAGSILAPGAGPPGLFTAAAVAHTGLSLGWGMVLSLLLPRRRSVLSSVLLGAMAGLAIATLDLGIVGRHLPRVRALPAGPQVADHLLYGATVGLVLSRQLGIQGQQGSE